MAITKVNIDPTTQPREAARPRSVTPEDAAAMKALPGEWFQIQLQTDTPSNASSMNGVLKRSLPSWYGGRWELITRQGTLFCRFLGH